VGAGVDQSEHVPDADHTYTLLQDRERMFTSVLAWMQSRF
jgi:hypothetical protein